MSEKKIFINPNAPSVATALISGVAGNPTNFPELFFGDAYEFVVKFTGDSEDGFVVPPAESFVFNLGLLARASAGTFVLEFDGEQTAPLPFDATAEDVATALNELEPMQNVGGCEVTGLGGSPYRIIFKNYGGRSKIGIQSSLFPDVAPISYVVESGSPDARAEQLIILKLDYVASVTDYTIDANAKELRFKVSLNTVECLLALGQADKVKLIAELKGISATGDVQTFVQVPATIYNRLIDVSALEYTIVELSGLVAQANAILEQFRSESAGITESIKTLSQIKSNRGEFYFGGAANSADIIKLNSFGIPLSFSLAFRLKADDSQTGTLSYLFRLSNGLFVARQSGLRVEKYTSTNTKEKTLIAPTNIEAEIFDGNWHSIIVTCTTTTLSWYYEKGLIATATGNFTDIQPNLFRIGGGGSTSGFGGQMADIKIFNFNMSDNNAPYTIADYINGKNDPLGVALLSLADYTIQRNSTTKVVLDESGNGNIATITGNVVGTKDSAISAFIDELKMQITQTS